VVEKDEEDDVKSLRKGCVVLDKEKEEKRGSVGSIKAGTVVYEDGPDAGQGEYARVVVW